METGLRDYQQFAVEDAVAFLTTALPGDKRMYGSPTGSGKSFMQVGLLERLPDLVQVVPSVEIAEGIYRKLTGKDTSGLSEAKLRAATESARIYTAKRLLNLLLAAKIPLPKMLSFDESHHTADDTHQTLHAITGAAPAVGFTATMFRGTPQETKKLHDSWRDRKVLLTIPAAVQRGVIACPEFRTWPLLNDDLIDVSKGEFKTTSIDSAVADKLEDIALRIGELYDGNLWDRPTMVAVNSVAAVEMLTGALRAAGLPVAPVTAKSSRSERAGAFSQCLARTHLLVQINVVSEGVDLAVRRLIDLSPTMSPVRWVQRLGRITRPTDDPPEYICCCHNITRHGYLWSGAIPPAAFTDAQKVWGDDYKPTRKALARAIGLDGLGRFQVSTVPLVSGLQVALYALQTKDGLDQFAVVLHPAEETPYYFHKRNQLSDETGQFVKNGVTIEFRKKIYGPWRRIDMIPDVEGCVSIPEERITENMRAKWAEVAEKYGLAADFKVDGRTFQILPICWNTKVRFPC